MFVVAPVWYVGTSKLLVWGKISIHKPEFQEGPRGMIIFEVHYEDVMKFM